MLRPEQGDELDAVTAQQVDRVSRVAGDAGVIRDQADATAGHEMARVGEEDLDSWAHVVRLRCGRRATRQAQENERDDR